MQLIVASAFMLPAAANGTCRRAAGVTLGLASPPTMPHSCPPALLMICYVTHLCPKVLITTSHI